MQRRSFLRHVGTALAHLPLARSVSALGASRRPNVLFISIDDLNDWIGVLSGHPQTQTPNIDKLAETAFLFEHAYCSVPYCLASRVALLTGVEPYRSGVYRLHNWREHLPEARTIPKHFHDNGYETVGAGKIYHQQNKNYIETRDPGAWDTFYQCANTYEVGDGRPFSGFEQLKEGFDPMDWYAVDAEPNQWADHKIAQRIGDYVAQPHEQPFFAACGFINTHLPWYVPQDYFSPFPLEEIQLPLVKDDDLSDVPSIGRGWARNPSRYPLFAHWLSGEFVATFGRGYDTSMRLSEQRASAVQAYLAAVHFVDAMVGKVLDALWAGPNADNTIVILWSDHGGHMGEKFSWSKFTLWEEATRVPFIVYVPPAVRLTRGIEMASARCSIPISLIDTFATLTELCGLPVIADTQSISLRPQIHDPTTSTNRAAITTWLRGNYSVRYDHYRYTLYRDDTEELYDHASDPMEWHNRSNDPNMRSIKSELKRFIPRNAV